MHRLKLDIEHLISYPSFRAYLSVITRGIHAVFTHPLAVCEMAWTSTGWSSCWGIRTWIPQQSTYSLRMQIYGKCTRELSFSFKLTTQLQAYLLLFMAIIFGKWQLWTLKRLLYAYRLQQYWLSACWMSLQLQQTNKWPRSTAVMQRVHQTRRLPSSSSYSARTRHNKLT